MSRDRDIELNAFVDGELRPDRLADFIAAMAHDPDLAREATELSRLKAQVQAAYEATTAPSRTARATRSVFAQRWVAGLALLAVGLFGGWLGSWALQGQGSMPERFVLVAGDERARAPATANSPETRIVFHVNNPDQTLAGELLDDIEDMLLLYRENGLALRIEIVSHGEGLALLSERLTAHRARIARLAATYDNLNFVACQNTIDRLRVERGIEVRLLPAAARTPSGVSHVVRRQKQGWSYIRV